jgi:hypothetical protein
LHVHDKPAKGRIEAPMILHFHRHETADMEALVEIEAPEGGLLAGSR